MYPISYLLLLWFLFFSCEQQQQQQFVQGIDLPPENNNNKLASIFGEHKKRHSHRIRNIPRNIYIDLGTNNGVSIDSFLPTGKSKKNQRDASDGAYSTNSKYFSHKDYAANSALKKTFDIYALEANPRHTPALRDQMNRYIQNNISNSYHLFSETGISTRDGTVALIFDCDAKRDDCLGAEGSSLNKDSLSLGQKSVNITSLDILTLFRGLHIKESDVVLLKMDIEGSEFEVVRRLLVSGVLYSLIDIIMVEWHHNAAFVFGHPSHFFNATDPRYAERLRVHEKYLKQYDALMWMAEDVGLKDKFLVWSR
jgi:FkbM family methyltransferase